MEELAEFAGLYAAYAMWVLSEGDQLTPFLAVESGEGPELVVLDQGRLDRAAEEGRKMLVAGAPGRRMAAVYYDAYLQLAEGRGDAMVVEAQSYGLGGLNFTLAVPYRRAEGRFEILPPQFRGCSEPGTDLSALAAAFFAGVDRDPAAAAAWDAHLADPPEAVTGSEV